MVTVALPTLAEKVSAAGYLQEVLHLQKFDDLGIDPKVLNREHVRLASLAYEKGRSEGRYDGHPGFCRDQGNKQNCIDAAKKILGLK